MSEIRPEGAESARPAPGGIVPPQLGAAAAEAAAELPRRAADAVQLVVDTIHDKAVRPAMLAARATVFGLIVATLAAVVLILGSVALLRLLDVYAFPGQIWASYLLLGGVLTVAGLVLWSRRTARPAPARAD